MPRIIYLSPADNTPTGGIKVIYRHAELLTGLGYDAFVLHPLDSRFRCSWFDHAVRFLDSLTLDPHTDFVVIPELWAGIFGPQCQELGVRYAIFVQNGYLTHPVLAAHSPELMRSVYQDADLILAISSDTAEMVQLNYPPPAPERLVRIQYCVSPAFRATERGAGLTRCITYMPRKMGDHARRVVFALQQHLPPGWRVQAIHNVDEATCAAMLSRSDIFLSFSEFEGLPLPPMEAALAGNLVIGYTGQGAKEYWDAPNFQPVQQGDILGFVAAARRAAEQIESGTFQREWLQPGIAALAERYSQAAEIANLAILARRIDGCFGSKVPHARGLPLAI